MKVWQMAGGKVAVEAVSDTIFRCVYTKNETVREPSELLERQAENTAVCSVKETEKTVTLTTGKVQVEIDRADGTCRFSEAGAGRVYLQEAGKSLSAVDVIHYTTGDEAPVIDRVKTVDGERNFIRNLKPVVDRRPFMGWARARKESMIIAVTASICISITCGYPFLFLYPPGGTVYFWTAAV